MIVDTVFSPSFGNRPSSMVGRDAILKDFENALKSAPGSMERSLVMLGQRGSGKTVLLWELGDRARNMGFCVASPSIAAEGMLDRIVEKIQDDGERFIKSKDSRLSGGSIGALGFSVGLQFDKATQEGKSAEYKLTNLARHLSSEGHGVLILVDELQANSPDVRRLVIAYQEMVGEGLNVALVLAGLPGAVSSTLNDKALTFLNRACRISLPNLESIDVNAFFTHAFKELGIAPEEGVQADAVKATEGSPYMLQLIGHALALHSDDFGKISSTEASHALADAKSMFMRNVCETALASLSEKDVDFLRAMAQDEGTSKTADIASRMGVERDYAQVYRRRMLDAGVVRAAGYGRLEFAVPYLAEYLATRDA